jgi:hypothetical protein
MRSEDTRKVTMPGLRERVISILCEEWWPDHPDNELDRADKELDSATIYERLKGAGGDDPSVTEVEVRQVLLQLSDHDDIKLVLEPGRESGPVVAYVDPELCP